VCPALQIPLAGLHDWEAYLAWLPKSQRHKVRQRTQVIADGPSSRQS
jgi:hypothetical protein